MPGPLHAPARLRRPKAWNSDPAVLTVAVTGADVFRHNNPNIPYTTAEIAEQSIAAGQAGATVVHLHVREDDGTPSGRPELFQDVISRIRQGSELITMVSTGGSNEMTIEERTTGLTANPDLSGVESGSMNFGDDTFITPPKAARGIIERATGAGIGLEVEAFDVGHVADRHIIDTHARILLQKLQNQNTGAVSGRRIYLAPDESKANALQRFGSGLRASKAFRPLICEYVNGAKFTGDIVLPFTNAIILTRKRLLQEFPFDSYYARGNGYREETDFQMNLFVHGYEIRVTNECHSFHLPLSQVRTGGQRTAPLKRLYWSIFYTRYFFDKYFDRYARRMKLKSPRWVALSAFALFAVYRETLRPSLHAAAMYVLTKRRGFAERHARLSG